VTDGGPGVDFVITKAARVLGHAAQFGGPRALLSRHELEAAGRFRNPADANGYVGAHLLFRLMAARALGSSPDMAGGLSIRRKCHSCGGPHGKPAIAGTSLSLSRAGETVMVASGPPGVPLGADLEAVPPSLHAGFDTFTLSPGERQALGGSDVVSRLKLWVAKEAALKAGGHGLSVDPGRLHLGMPRPPGTTPAGWSASIDSSGLLGAPEARELHGLAVAWVTAPAGFAAALATKGHPQIRAVDVGTACGGPKNL
jgi:4'-phosphopantetheinyl transferase